LVNLAGPEAQMRFNKDCFLGTLAADFGNVLALAMPLNDGDVEAACVYLKPMVRRAKQLIADDWGLVTAVANRLLANKTLNQADAISAISDALENDKIFKNAAND
jgi:hypothetical protein